MGNRVSGRLDLSRWSMPSGPRHGQGLLEAAITAWKAAITAGFERASAVSSPAALAILGGLNLVGETLGYLLTAAWTLLVLVALGRTFAGRWFIALGAVSAVLVLAGVLSPLDLPGIDLANFIGYVLWSV